MDLVLAKQLDWRMSAFWPSYGFVADNLNRLHFINEGRLVRMMTPTHTTSGVEVHDQGLNRPLLST